MKGQPDHFISPKLKDGKWILDNLKYYWNNNMFAPDAWYRARSRYDMIREYALGRQSTEKYKKLIDMDVKDNMIWVNVDWSVLRILPKFRRIVHSMVSKVVHSVDIRALDSTAKVDEEKYRAKMETNIALNEISRKIGYEEGVMDTEPAPGEPRDLEELDVFMTFGYKHAMAIAMEKAVEMVLDHNESDRLLREIKMDLIDFGVGGVKEWIDSSGVVRIRKVDPRNVVVVGAMDGNFEKAEAIGEIVRMSVLDIKKESGGSIPGEELAKVARNAMSNAHTSVSYDDMSVDVLDLEFYSVNTLVFEERKTKAGNRVIGRASLERAMKALESERFIKVDFKVVYRCKWIIGTDFIWDFGLLNDMKRAKNNIQETRLSYHLCATDYHDGKSLGLMEQAIAIIDNIQIAWIKLQGVIARARPKGISIEFGSLEGIAMGAKSEEFTPTQIIDLYNQTGTIIYRLKDEAGVPSNPKPITELQNGIGDEAQRYFNLIQTGIQLLRDVLGINEMVDGSSPDPRVVKDLAQLSQQAANNSVWNIVTATRDMYEDLCEDIVVRIQMLASIGKMGSYLRGIGRKAVEVLEVDPHVGAHDFGIVISDEPSEADRMRLEQMMAEARARNEVTIADIVMLRNIKNLKMAEAMLSYKVTKNMEEAHQRNLEMQQAQAQAAQVASQAKMQELQMKSQMDAQMEQLRHQHKMEQIQLEFSLKMEIAKQYNETMYKRTEREREGKTEVASIQGEAHKEGKRIAKGDSGEMPFTPDPMAGDMMGSRQEMEQEIGMDFDEEFALSGADDITMGEPMEDAEDIMMEGEEEEEELY